MQLSMPGSDYIHALHVRGAYSASFCFPTQEARQQWVRGVFPTIVSRHGPCSLRCETRTPLHIGDSCRVAGEGGCVFTVLHIHEWGPGRVSVCLDSGWKEEITKCTKVS